MMSTVSEWVFTEQPVALAIEFTKVACQGCIMVKEGLKACSSCNTVKYCSIECQKKNWKIHKHECPLIQAKKYPVDNPFMLLYRCLLMIKLGKFPDINHFQSNMEFIKAELDTKIIKKFEMIREVCFESHFTMAEIIHVYSIIKTNIFAITVEVTDILGFGLYKSGSKINHSCYPNIEYIFNGSRAYFFRPLPEDTSRELKDMRITYIDLFDNYETRKTRLQEVYYFECDCIRCTDEDRIKAEKSIICCGVEGLDAKDLTPKKVVELEMKPVAGSKNLFKCQFCDVTVENNGIDCVDISEHIILLEKAFVCREDQNNLWRLLTRNPYNSLIASLINRVIISLEQAPIENILLSFNELELALIISLSFDWLLEQFIPKNIPINSSITTIFLEYLMKFFHKIDNKLAKKEHRTFLVQYVAKYQRFVNELVEKKDVRIFVEPYIRETFSKLYKPKF